MEGDKSSPLPLIPRLDRLDHLLNYLEERRNSSGKYSNGVTDSVSTLQAKQDQHIRPLASVLEEVPSKGSLMERVAVLEDKALQLYLEMEGGERMDFSRISLPEEGKDASAGDKGKSSGLKKRSRGRINGISAYRRWLRWSHVTC